MSRDDAETSFLSNYLATGIFDANPFATLDPKGVGKLLDTALKSARRLSPDLVAGVCGEHGGDPASIALCHSYGLTYVSCSPFRIPVARLAAAHAALEDRR